MKGIMLNNIYSMSKLTGKVVGGNKLFDLGPTSRQGLPRDFFSIFTIFQNFSLTRWPKNNEWVNIYIKEFEEKGE